MPASSMASPGRGTCLSLMTVDSSEREKNMVSLMWLEMKALTAEGKEGSTTVS